MDEFERAIIEFDVDGPPQGVSALGHRSALAALKGIRDELAAQLSAFEDLERRGIEAVRFERLADLPRALIETRIARGMTQKEIAAKMEIPSQQVQRWEANYYDRTGLEFVLEVGEILNFDEVLRRNQLASSAADVPGVFQLKLQDQTFSAALNKQQDAERSFVVTQEQAASAWFIGGALVSPVQAARYGTASKSGSKEALGPVSISSGTQDVYSPVNSFFQGQQPLAKVVAA
jgi:transcriptional regulator with XRE-family HTH domain